MIKFGLDNYTEEFDNWSKHHKQIGVLVKRTYPDLDREPNLTKNQELLALVEKYPEKMKQKTITLTNFNTHERFNGVEHYLLLDNHDYTEANVDYYSIGSNNTKQTSHIRLTFQLEYDIFKTDITVKTSGSHALSMYDMLCVFDAIEGWLDELTEEPDSLINYGIEKYDGDDGDYRIILIQQHGEAIPVEIEKRELLAALTGVELYAFDLEIIEND